MKLLTQWAFTSSALILIVLAVRVLFRNKLSARLRYALWGVVLLRLLIPFQVELPADTSAALPVLASNLAQDVTPRLDDTLLYAIPTEEQPYGLPAGMPPQYARNGPYDDWEYYSGGVVYNGEHVTRYAFMMTALEVLVLIWIAGTALTALVILLSNLRFAHRLRKRRERLENVDAPIPVYVAEGLPSPCLFGVFRPAVYVTPQAAEDPDTLRHVLAHELTHYAHKDHIWSLLRCFSLALHWYNPLVWLAVALSKGDGELACDEGAVARLGEAERIPYGRTLVDMVAARSPRPGDLLSCSTAMTGGGKSVKQRVAQIVKKPETVKAALFAVVALVALSAVFVFAGRGEQRPNLYGPYRYQVGRTQAVRYAPSPFSSQAYPDAITDPDLLKKALDILDSAADLLNTPEELGLDLSDAPFLSPRVTLLENTDGSADGHTYLLYTHRLGGSLERCYLVTPAEIGAESYAVAAVLDSSAPGALELLARQQMERNRDPSLPRRMTQEELSQYTPQFLLAHGVQQLQGWPDGMESAVFHVGITSPDSIQLWYQGDETHGGVWVLELSRNSYTVLSDQPMEIYNAAHRISEEESYEQLGPGAFIASLRTEDVIGAYLSQYGVPLPSDGTEPQIDIGTIKEQAVQGLFHQRSAKYTEEKHGQYSLTILVEKDVDYYLHDGGADGLTLSIGTEPDVVCMRHRIMASPQREMGQYIYSPELYQTIRTLFD